MTIHSDNAHRFAARDRTQRADQVLTAACRDAVEIYRIGREHGDKWAHREAQLVIAGAELRASRILGPSAVAS